MINIFRKQQGQGLIESLMIAIFIGFSAIAFINFQSYLAYHTELSQQKANANLLAEARMESLRYFSVQNTTAGYTAYQGIVSSSQSTTVGNTTYTSTWTVTTTASPAYKNINVAVTWTDRRGIAQTVRLVTNIANIDPSEPASYF